MKYTTQKKDGELECCIYEKEEIMKQTLPIIILTVVIVIQSVQIIRIGSQLDKSESQTDTAIKQTQEAINVAKREKILYDSAIVMLKECMTEQAKYQVNWK